MKEGRRKELRACRGVELASFVLLVLHAAQGAPSEGPGAVASKQNRPSYAFVAPLPPPPRSEAKCDERSARSSVSFLLTALRACYGPHGAGFRRRPLLLQAASLDDEEEEDDAGLGVTRIARPSQPNAALSNAALNTAALEALADEKTLSYIDEKRRKDQRRGEMEARGLSPEQIGVYMGEDTSSRATRKSSVEAEEEEMLNRFQEVAARETAGVDARRKLLGKAPSHTLVEKDETGDPMYDRFVYVDEYTCIGCTHCSHTAPNTFFMEDGHGRARVFQQGHDSPAVTQEAIETCPVDCIHFVGWEELQRLEREREGIQINFKARLVGNFNDVISFGQQEISGNSAMRCSNCPTRGCKTCPMYSIGENPEYLKRKQKTDKKRQASLLRTRQRMQREAGTDRSAEL